MVNFADANKAVLRPRTTLTSKVLHFGGGSSTRIIVEFPRGYTPPAQGAIVNRDETRPYEITEVRKQEDGQLNVFVREIMASSFFVIQRAQGWQYAARIRLAFAMLIVAGLCALASLYFAFS